MRDLLGKHEDTGSTHRARVKNLGAAVHICVCVGGGRLEAFKLVLANWRGLGSERASVGLTYIHTTLSQTSRHLVQ